MGLKVATIRRVQERTWIPVSNDTKGSSERPSAWTFPGSLEISTGLEVWGKTVGFVHHELYWRMVSVVKQLGSSWKELSGYQLPADDSSVAISGSVAWCENLVCRKDENKLIRKNSEAASWLIVNVRDSCWAWLKCGDWKVQSWHTFSPVKDWRGSCKSRLSGLGTHVA